MAIYRGERRVDAREVLDEFEMWLLRKRSAQERTADFRISDVVGEVAKSERGPAARWPAAWSNRACLVGLLFEWII